MLQKPFNLGLKFYLIWLQVCIPALDLMCMLTKKFRKCFMFISTIHVIHSRLTELPYYTYQTTYLDKQEQEPITRSFYLPY